MPDPVSYTRHGDIAVLTIDNPPVNALSHQVRVGLLEGIEQAEQDAAIKALLLVGQGRCFIAGADIKEFGQPAYAPLLPDLCNRLEKTALVVVAALHGVCLGGGLELALAAHYRVARPDAQVGLPEVNLGLIPGSGGTQRLPRLTGTEAAIKIITQGRRVMTEDALALGILDAVQDGEIFDVGLSYTRRLLSEGATPRPTCALPCAGQVDWDEIHDATLKRSKGQIAPAQAVRAIQASATLPVAEGLRAERAIFTSLMQGEQRQGMIHAFFAERAAAHLPEAQNVTPRPLAHLGVIGGGTMGAGIATAALLSGFTVTVVETDDRTSADARSRIESIIAGAAARGKIDHANCVSLLNEHLSCASELRALAESDLVIEAVVENIEIKHQVFAQLGKVCKSGAILATNTSYLDVNDIAAATSRPADVLGLHFFSPAHVMKLLEVVVADKTAPEVTATGFALAKALGKVAVRAGVCDGFIGNRILQSCRAAADLAVLAGATPQQVDAALERFGYAMGPYAVADLAGLDIGWANRKRHRALQAKRPRFPDQLCEKGHFGRKTGCGYYHYDGPLAGQPNEEVLDLIAAERATRGRGATSMTDVAIVQRYMAAMVNEAAKILDDGIASRPSDVDVVLLAGYGFPRFRGGPCKWADMQGLASVSRSIQSFAAEDAELWTPAPLLQQMVSAGTTFEDLNKAAG